MSQAACTRPCTRNKATHAHTRTCIRCRYEGAQLLHLPLGWQDGEGPSYDQVALGQGLGQGQSQGVPSTLPHADHPQDDATATATTPPPPPASGERRPGAGLFSSGYVGRDVHSSGGGGGHHGHPLLPAVSQLLYYALSLSAWKESRRHGADVWSLRVNPSAGNLHPTEVSRGVEEQACGVAGHCVCCRAVSPARIAGFGVG